MSGKTDYLIGEVVVMNSNDLKKDYSSFYCFIAVGLLIPFIGISTVKAIGPTPLKSSPEQLGALAAGQIDLEERSNFTPQGGMMTSDSHGILAASSMFNGADWDALADEAVTKNNDGAEPEPVDVNQFVNQQRENVGGAVADCCTGANLSLPGCIFQMNICQDYFPRTIEIDENITQTAEFLFQEAAQVPDVVKQINACQECIGQSYRSSSSGEEPDEGQNYNDTSDFRRDYGTYLGAYQHALKSEFIHEKFSALHQLNDNLYRFYGIHHHQLDDLYEDQNPQDVLKQITCSDPQALLRLIKNPAPNSICGARKASLGDSEYMSALNSDENFLIKMGATGNSLEKRIENYFNSFNYASNTQCLARTRHGQALAGHFHSRPTPTDENPYPVDNSLLVTGIFDQVFTKDRLQPGGDIKNYCDSGIDVLPYSFIQMSFVDVVNRVMTSNASSELKRAMRIWGGQGPGGRRLQYSPTSMEALVEEGQRIAASGGTLQQSDSAMFVGNVGAAMANLMDMEPTLGLVIADKEVFCNRYVPSRLEGSQATTLNFISSVYQGQNSAQSAKEIIEGAAANCQQSYQEVADALCVDGSILTDTIDGRSMVSPQLVERARRQFQQVNFSEEHHGDEVEHDFEPLGHQFTPNQITFMEGAARCEDIYEGNGRISASTHMFSHLYAYSQFNPNAQDEISFQGVDRTRVEFANHARDNSVGEAYSRNFQLLAGALIPTREERAENPGQACAEAIDLNPEIRNLYTTLGGFPPGRELDRLLQGPASKDAEIISFDSYSEENRSGAIRPDELHASLSDSMVASAEDTAAAVDTTSAGALAAAMAAGAASGTSGARPDLLTKATDRQDLESRTLASTDPGVTTTTGGQSVKQMLDASGSGVGETDSGGGSTGRAPASNGGGSTTQTNRDAKTFNDLIDQRNSNVQQFNNSRDYFNSSASRVAEDENLSANDVQRAITNSDEDGNNFQQRFNSALTDLKNQTDQSDDEALANLQNAIADPALEQRLSESEQISEDLRQEIARLRDLVQASKNKDVATDVEERSDEYVQQLERRIAELEAQRPGAASSTSNFNGGRTLADVSRGGNVGPDQRSLGPVREGRPTGSYFTPEPTIASDGTEYIGNLVAIDRIVQNVDQYLAQNDFNLEYRDSRLVLRVNGEGINQPIDVSDIIVNRETGEVQSVVFPGNRVLSTSQLNPESLQALSQYVEQNEPAITASLEAELVALQAEREEVIQVREVARSVAGSPDNVSLFRRLEVSTQAALDNN